MYIVITYSYHYSCQLHHIFILQDITTLNNDDDINNNNNNNYHHQLMILFTANDVPLITENTKTTSKHSIHSPPFTTESYPTRITTADEILTTGLCSNRLIK